MSQILITLFIDCGLWDKLRGGTQGDADASINSSSGKKAGSSKTSNMTQVQPIQSTNRGHNDDTIGELASLRNWGHEERTQRRIDIAQKTTAVTTTAVTVTKEMPKIVPKEKTKTST